MQTGLMISGQLGLHCFEHLLEKYPGTVSCVLTDKASDGIIALAEARGIPLFVGVPRNNKASDFIRIHAIDLLLSINYLFLVDEDIISWPRIAAINFHGSLLPRYRGRTPHVWAIINGEREAGVTGHLMTVECDAGDIVIQQRVEITPDMTGGELLSAYNQLYPGMIDQVLDQLNSGKLQAVVQDHEQATSFGKRTPDDGNIDWNQNRERIRNWVRAQADPYPGAFTFYQGEKIIIDRVSFSEAGYDPRDPDGMILEVSPKLLVKARDGVLSIDVIRNPEKCIFEPGKIFGT